MIKKVFLNTAAQLIGKTITASTTLLLTIIIGKSLGPAGYGDFTKIFTFVGYFYIFSDFGLNAAYIRLSQYQKGSTLINVLFGLRLSLALALAIIAIGISQILPYDTVAGTGFSPLVKIGIAIASITIITQALLTSVNAYFQRNLRYDLSALAAVFGTFATLGATIFAFLYSPALNMYVGSYVTGGLIVVCFALYFTKRYLKFIIWPKLSVKSSRALLGLSWPVGVALIFNLIYFRMDIFILSYTRPPAEVGIYGLAYQFFEASLAVPIFFANSLFPMLTTLYAKDKKEYRVQTKRWGFLLTGISALATFGLITISFIIPFIFEKFKGSQTALIILALGMPFFYITALLWHMTIVTNRQKLLIPVYFTGGIANVLLNLAFIPKYGYLAAAISTVVSEALITLLLIAAVKYRAKESEHHLAN